jgi:thiamine-monophosphate kinase
VKTIDDKKTIQEVGERFIVRDITNALTVPNILLDGFGHDAAFVDLPLASGEILVINTDRSGLNIAFQLGLAGAECVGDLGVSHAISDVVAAGGRPRAVTIALLLPPSTEVGFVRKVMEGAQRAAERYGAVVVGGDTKQNAKFAMVVTAIGTAQRDKRLRRSTARSGDAFVVTGFLGSMLLGSVAHKQRLNLTNDVQKVLDHSLINQHPPFEIGLAFSDAGVANACIDISDGLSGALYSICSASGVGAVIDEERLPINPQLIGFANSLGLRSMQLTLAGGDWQYLYAIPENKISEAQRIAEMVGTPISVIGCAVKQNMMAVRTKEGSYRHMNKIEHDSFGDKHNGMGYFETLGKPIECFGNFIEKQRIDDALSQ